MVGERPTSVVVDGFELNGVDGFGAEYRFEKITGWHEPVRVDVDETQRIVSHGQFGQRGHRTGRLATITGRVYAARELMPDAIDRLNAILADGEFGRFEFHDRIQGERWARVQLGPNAIRGTWDGSPTFAYQLELLAPDPYKYGATSTGWTGFATAPVGTGMVFPLFPNGVMNFGPLADATQTTVANAGTAEAQVTFVVTSPGALSGGFVITDITTGKTVTYAGSIPADGSLVLDGSDGTVILNGTSDRLGDTLVQAWPTLSAGASKSFLFERISGSGAPILTVSVTSTFW